MRMRPRRFICTTIALISLVLLSTGCAQRMQSVKEDSLIDGNGPAALQAIKVSEDGYQVEITSSQPVTYTSYKVATPLKVVVDIAQTEPGAITAPVDVKAGIVKRIEVARHGFAENVLSRVEIELASDSEYTVSTASDNKKMLLVTFAKPQPEQAGAKTEAKVEEKQPKVEDLTPVASVPAKIEEKQVKAEDKPAVPAAKDEPLAAVGQKAKVLTAINVVADGVEIVVQGGVDTFKSFRLTSPYRLVVDISGVKSSFTAKSVAVKSFGIDKARLGISPDKVRIVFDMGVNTLLPYRVEKSENGLKVLLQGVPPATPIKAGTEAAKEPVAQKTETASEPVAQKVKEAGTATSKTSSVEAIDFKSVEGYSQISVKVSGACSAEKPKKSAGGWVLTIKNCQLPRKLQRMLDTSAFTSAVKEITPYQVKIRGGYNTKLLVKLHSDAPFNFSQEGGTVYWSIKNPEIQEKPAAASEAAKPAACTRSHDSPEGERAGEPRKRVGQ